MAVMFRTGMVVQAGVFTGAGFSVAGPLGGCIGLAAGGLVAIMVGVGKEIFQSSRHPLPVKELEKAKILLIDLNKAIIENVIPFLNSIFLTTIVYYAYGCGADTASTVCSALFGIDALLCALAIPLIVEDAFVRGEIAALEQEIERLTIVRHSRLTLPSS